MLDLNQGARGNGALLEATREPKPFARFVYEPQGPPMPSYRVCFINEIPRGGKLFHCCQRTIVIRSARSPERAIEAAKRRFERAECIHAWNIHAGTIEIEETDLAVPPRSRRTGKILTGCAGRLLLQALVDEASSGRRSTGDT